MSHLVLRELRREVYYEEDKKRHMSVGVKTALIIAPGGIIAALFPVLYLLYLAQGAQPSNACPSADTVAQLMNLPLAGAIRKINNEPCAFAWGAHGISTNQAHCPERHGAVSVDVTVTSPPSHPKVIECSGDNPLLEIYALTVRFEKWNPNSTACQIAQKHYQSDHTVEGLSGCLLKKG